MGKPYTLNCDGEIVSLMEYCRRKNLSYGGIRRYKSRHPNIIYEDIIKFYENRIINTRLRNIWRQMLNRCYDSCCKAYKNYGGRGIIVYEAWHEYDNFAKDMYKSYQKHIEEYGEKDTTLDRINVDKNYEPSNCRWATLKEQQNNKRNTIYLPSGESLTEYCEKNNLNYNTICARLKRGWNVNEALTKPIKQIKQFNRIILSSGEYLSDYCRRNNLDIRLIYLRLDRGWTLEDAISKPKNK